MSASELEGKRVCGEGGRGGEGEGGTSIAQKLAIYLGVIEMKLKSAVELRLGGGGGGQRFGGWV